MVGQHDTASKHDLGALVDGDEVASGAALQDDSLQQAVQEAAFLLGGEAGPGIKEAAVGEFGGELVVLVELGEGLSGRVEGVLAGLGTLNEAGFAQQRQELGVGDIEVELMLGVLDGAGGGVELFAGLNGLGKWPAVCPQRDEDLVFNIAIDG